MSVTGRRAYGAARDAVLCWLAKQPPGLEFHYTDIAEELDLPAPSVNGTLSTLVRTLREDSPVLKGYAQGRYIAAGGESSETAGEPEQEDRASPRRKIASEDYEVMEVIGRTKDGSPLLKDEYGKTWKAVEL